MKALGIVIGVLLAIGGIYCMMTPIITFTTIGWVVGAAMLFEGLTSVFTWSERKRLGFADGWTLAGAIASAVLGVIVMFSGIAQLAIDAMLAYLAAIWLLVGGVTRIVVALKLRSVHSEGRPLGEHWGLLLVAGILFVIMGLVCLFHPLLTMASVGFLIGLGLLSAGCGLVIGELSQ